MKKTILAISICIAAVANNVMAQVKPVDPSTFAGLYYTESKMKVESGSFKKKTDEINLSFNQESGALTGAVSDAGPDVPTLNFKTDDIKLKRAKKTGIWYWKNDGNNKSVYGEMFYYNYVTLATFIEDGVLLLFDGKWSSENKFIANSDPKYVTILAKDRSKLKTDKVAAVKSAENMLNASVSEGDIPKPPVPNETLSKTDKSLKKEVLEYFNALPLGEGDQSDFICAYTTSNDWNIVTNKATGAILGREINAEMIRKGKVSGKCRRFPYTLYQQYNGSGYGKLTFQKKWDLIECDCSQTDKNK